MAMREHLFRGYSQEYGWVYGDNSDPHGNYPANIFPREDTANYDAYEGIAVDPETVGEFTGLTDKNGTQIFEGDIVADCETGQKRGVVKWLDEYSCFAKTYVKPQGEVFEYMNMFAKYTEVIGNIFDNPELIGGEQK